MSHRPTLAEFVDQELRLSEPLFGGLVDAVLKQWRTEPPSRLASDMDALRVLHLHRQDFVRQAMQAMIEHTQRRPAPPAAKPGRLELSLVDDDEVTADIEIARVVERANAELEDPLRELRTYTSALVGDVNTARDTNPLRPEVWVRALMAAARSVPISRAMQIALLRSAAVPLIQAIQDCYGAACARLQMQGITPSVHRTVVNEGVTTELSEAMRVRRALDRAEEEREQAQALPGSVEELLQHLEQGLSALPLLDERSLRAADAAAAASHASERREQRTVERLSDLYDAILSDRRLPRESLPLLSRLYPAALRQTLAEPTLIDDAAHPVWHFMDHLAFLVQTRAVGDVKSNLAFAQGLIEQLVNQPSADVRPFQSAANRLAVLERQRFARAVAAASADIATLSVSLRTAGIDQPPSVPQSLDAGGLESEPAPLRRGGDAAPTPADAADAWRAGSWLTLFVRGQWRRVLVLWRAPKPGPLLLLDANEARHWALRPAALERLVQAGLARTLTPRSLVRDASGRIGHVSRDPGPTLFG
jgi:hypothetical protein